MGAGVSGKRRIPLLDLSHSNHIAFGVVNDVGRMAKAASKFVTHNHSGRNVETQRVWEFGMRHKAIAVVHELVAFVHVATVDETPFYMEFPTLHDDRFAHDDRKPEQVLSDIVSEWVQSNKRFLAFDWGVSWHNWADANDRQNSGHSMAVVVDRNRHLINFFDSNGTPITSPLIKCLPNTLHMLEQALANNGFSATVQQWFGTRKGQMLPEFFQGEDGLIYQERGVCHAYTLAFIDAMVDKGLSGQQAASRMAIPGKTAWNWEGNQKPGYARAVEDVMLGRAGFAGSTRRRKRQRQRQRRPPKRRLKRRP